jgi:hypothetical protein
MYQGKGTLNYGINYQQNSSMPTKYLHQIQGWNDVT